jgi:hypothetical protein
VARKQYEQKKEDRFGPLPAPEAVVIGNLADKVTFKDTATHFGIYNVLLEKQEMAAVCGCGVEDKCWGVAMCKKPWPLKLGMCNKAGQPGHEAHESAQHRFTFQQLKAIGAMCVKAKKAAP